MQEIKTNPEENFIDLAKKLNQQGLLRRGTLEKIQEIQEDVSKEDQNE